jgi:hypothetical protein
MISCTLAGQYCFGGTLYLYLHGLHSDIIQKPENWSHMHVSNLRALQTSATLSQTKQVSLCRVFPLPDTFNYISNLTIHEIWNSMYLNANLLNYSTSGVNIRSFDTWPNTSNTLYNSHHSTPSGYYVAILRQRKGCHWANPSSPPPPSSLPGCVILLPPPPA